MTNLKCKKKQYSRFPDWLILVRNYPPPPLSLPQPSFINPLPHKSPKLISTLLSSRDRALGPAATQ